jgi:cellulose biosynthesis protein BcsQ
VTTARSPLCKRGVAVNLAASLARAPDGGRVCLVDADPFARDVTTRLPSAGPFLEDFARTAPPDARDLHRCVAPPMTVVGLAGEALGRIRFAADRVVPVLDAAFDTVVWDLPGGPTGPGQVLGALTGALDWLLLAVTPSRGEAAAAAHFVEHVATARSRGALGPVGVGVVATGDENSAQLDDRALAAAVGAPVLGRVPQLWGRAEPNVGFGAALAIPELDAAVGCLVGRLRAEPPGHPAIAAGD